MRVIPYTTTKVYFDDELQRTMQQKRISVQQLADKTGLSLPLIEGMASGQTEVSMASANKLAVALGIQFYELCGNAFHSPAVL